MTGSKKNFTRGKKNLLPKTALDKEQEAEAKKMMQSEEIETKSTDDIISIVLNERPKRDDTYERKQSKKETILLDCSRTRAMNPFTGFQIKEPSIGETINKAISEILPLFLNNDISFSIQKSKNSLNIQVD